MRDHANMFGTKFNVEIDQAVVEMIQSRCQLEEVTNLKSLFFLLS